ncbi:hypothetical protein [Streptomyces sp. NPDC093991]|uniref:hypothetical protein n=1 Tax=unclassified Streptomyces TaxID=2593676 RepID=UPI00342A2E72
MTATAFPYGPNHALGGPSTVAAGADAPQWPAAAGQSGSDCLLAPPDPATRVGSPIDPRDRRRLELHAALTAAGIPPRPEDREAIESLSALSPGVNTTIQRWLHHTL